MKSLDDLIDSASELKDLGLSNSEIADELNVSRETAAWLVGETGAEAASNEPPQTPEDIHIDYSAIGRDSERLTYVGKAMADLMVDEERDVDLTVGIGKSGGPLATTVAQELDTDLAVYTPLRDENTSTTGSFSRNFAAIEGRDCYIVDDNIDTGQTMTETITAIENKGGNPVAGVVLTDKRGDDDVAGVPIHSMIQVVQVTED